MSVVVEPQHIFEKMTEPITVDPILIGHLESMKMALKKFLIHSCNTFRVWSWTICQMDHFNASFLRSCVTVWRRIIIQFTLLIVVITLKEIYLFRKKYKFGEDATGVVVKVPIDEKQWFSNEWSTNMVLIFEHAEWKVPLKHRKSLFHWETIESTWPESCHTFFLELRSAIEFERNWKNYHTKGILHRPYSLLRSFVCHV